MIRDLGFKVRDYGFKFRDLNEVSDGVAVREVKQHPVRIQITIHSYLITINCYPNTIHFYLITIHHCPVGAPERSERRCGGSAGLTASSPYTD